MSSANRDNYISSFLISVPFISFPCLITLARTSIDRSMLNRIGENVHPNLFPDLRREAFVYSPLSMMLALGLSYKDVIMLTYVLYPIC